MQGQQIYYTQQNLPNNDEFDDSLNRNEILKQFQGFLEEWQTQKVFTYRKQMEEIKGSGLYNIQVSLDDLIDFDDNTKRTQLAKILRSKPSDTIPLFEQGARQIFARQQNLNLEEVPEFQVQITSTELPMSLRDLRSTKINQLVTVQGIIVNSQRVQLKASELCIKCRNCGNEQLLKIGQGMSQINLPRFCQKVRENNQEQQEKCPNDPYVVIPEQSKIIDQQILKIQENTESVPSGEIPRTFQICMDRYLASKLVPGSRVKLTGIYNVIEKQNSNSKNGKQLLRMPYIYVVGFQTQNIRNQNIMEFTNDELEKFHTLANDPSAYEKISQTIASQIYGSEDIKKAISCLLFGGSKKLLPDRTKLRGDINVLLIGDPSTAKSQFLKFVERVAPIAVYTSGKGSSAAGLTASIIRDPSTREFQLEGGAMVLADGGIVCIDEFDKMKPEDRVSIHEAMEQQTISIAKAGICTILNSRTSVLAAANPIFGRYDDLKAISDQIELQTTILSRFDCIFIVRDIRSEEHDKRLANHILDLHMNKHQMDMEQQDLSLEFLKKYIHYARQQFSPRLSEDAAKQLQNMYVEDRKKVADAKKSKKSHIPITVRQLEAIIRLSESLAKMKLSNEVKEVHVNEAHRLFAVSTLNAIQNGLDQKVDIPEQLAPLVQKVEESIKRRVATGGKISYAKLSSELTNKFQNQQAVEMAILNMVKNGDFKQSEGSKMLQRIK